MRAIVDRFVRGVNGARIPWCHWKSNEHFEAGCCAYTDLDLLFPDDRSVDVEAVLKDTGYVEFTTPVHRTYPHIADFIGLAEETGQLVHLQCHYALTLGEEHLKGYVLPWASEILHRRVSWAQDERLWTADPADELLLLIVRGALKLRWRDRLPHRRGRFSEGSDFEREFSWLKARVGIEELRGRATALLGEEHETRIVRICGEGARLRNMAPASRELRALAGQRGWRRMGTSAALLTRWKNESIEVFTRVWRVLGIRWPWIAQRRVRRGNGLIIALIGVDGSGKSSLTRAILKDWQEKLDIEAVYFGTGDGQRSPLFRLASLAARFIRTRTTDRTSVAADLDVTGWKQILRAVLTARQKRNDMKWARNLRARGVIVICDRYPQNQITGYNDGPRLRSHIESPSVLRRMAARYEARTFDDLVRTVPDTAIRLKPSIEVALRRKDGETPREILERKLEEMLRLEFPASTPAPVIDADMPFDAVLLHAKHHIWKAVAR